MGSTPITPTKHKVTRLADARGRVCVNDEARGRSLSRVDSGALRARQGAKSRCQRDRGRFDSGRPLVRTVTV